MRDEQRVLEGDVLERANSLNQSSMEERRRSVRAVLEPLAIGIMVLGYFLIFQPFSITLYAYSLTVMLLGTVMYIIASHLPE